MSGLKRARLIWTIVFLGITLTAIVMECVAGLWHPTGWTIPWTEYLARYVPWPIQLVAYVVLAVWLPFHFWRHDHMRKIAYNKGADAMRRRMDKPLEGFASQALQRELVSRGYYMASSALMPGEDVSLGPWPVPRGVCTCLAPAVHGHHCGR